MYGYETMSELDKELLCPHILNMLVMLEDILGTLDSCTNYGTEERILSISILTHIKSEFSKILIAVDGSQSSMNAADRAIALAKKEKNSDSPQLLIALYVVFSRLGYAYSPAGVFVDMDGLVIPNPVKQILKGAKKKHNNGLK